ncbi:MAG TPA: TonB-dependent receptor [Patescibacteria group bacterium]|nr:TonB-dependent receptor [Patescibacteria group bacterium]
MLRRSRCGVIGIVVIFSYPGGLGAQDAPRELPPIVVSRAPLAHPYTLETAETQDTFAGSFVEELASLPVDLQSRSLRASIQTDFSLRGSGPSGVLVLVDGRRLNDPQTAHHNSDIPLTAADIERIEVLPQAASARFGPDAIGGALAFVRKEPGEKQRIAEATIGSHRSGRGLVSVGDKKGDLSFRVSSEADQSAGFRYDTDFKKYTATADSRLDLPDGQLYVNMGYQQKQFGAFDFYTPGSGFPSQEQTRTYLCASGLTLTPGSWSIHPDFFWRRHYDTFLLDKTLQRSLYLNHHRTDIYSPNVYLENQFSASARAGFGLEYRQEEIASANLGGHRRDQKSVYADTTLHFLPGLCTAASVRRDDYAGFGAVTTGSLDMRYELARGIEVYAGAARNIRVPSFTDLYYNDPVTLGDPGLSAEQSLNYQFGCDYRRRSWSVGGALFGRREHDFIDYVKHQPDQAKWQAENITASQVAGLQAYAQAKLDPHLTMYSNYTYVNRRIHEQGLLYKYGPNYARHLWNALLSWDLPFGVQTAELTYKKRPSRRGWFLMNIGLTRNLNTHALLFCNLTNALNVEFQEIVGIPQPGRWVEAGLKLRW